MKNANVKGFDKDRNPVLYSSKAKIEGRRMLRTTVSTLFPSNQSASNVMGLDTWNKNVQHISSQLGKARLLSAFTTTVDPTEGIVEAIDEEEDLVESKFEKMDEQYDIHIAYTKFYKVSEKHEKLYRLATKKLSDVELDREELSTKVDEANQTNGAL